MTIPAEVDLFVIGGGSGGVRAARVAAEHGARVAIAEERRWGGTCVIRGCVPKKLYVYASAVSAQLADAAGYGWTVEGARFDWPTLRRNVDAEIERLSRAYQANLDRRGVVRVDARAVIAGDGVVEVGGQRVRAERILVATGGAPRRPPIPGAEHMLTSDDVFLLDTLPRSMLVVGGGYIGLEFAHVFAGLGVRVTLLHHGPVPLRGFDEEVRRVAAEHLAARGIAVHADCEPASVDATGATCACGRRFDVERVLAATGRTPSSDRLGLDAVGVARDVEGRILVDEWQATSAPGIAAVGDVTGRIALTPIAIREGQAYADTVFGGRPTPFVADHVPTAVFAQPAIASVGLTEEEARARGEVAVWRARFRPLRHTVAGRDERVLLKVVADAATRRLLGIHMVGDDAPEIVQVAAVLVAAGATKDDLDRTVALHPTVAEELVLLR